MYQPHPQVLHPPRALLIQIRYVFTSYLVVQIMSFFLVKKQGKSIGKSITCTVHVHVVVYKQYMTWHTFTCIHVHVPAYVYMQEEEVHVRVDVFQLMSLKTLHVGGLRPFALFIVNHTHILRSLQCGTCMCISTVEI